MHSSLLHPRVSSGDESPTCGLGTVETHQRFLQVFSKKQHTYANMLLTFSAFFPAAPPVKTDQGGKWQLVDLESTRPTKVYYPTLNLVLVWFWGFFFSCQYLKLGNSPPKASLPASPKIEDALRTLSPCSNMAAPARAEKYPAPSARTCALHVNTSFVPSN